MLPTPSLAQPAGPIYRVEVDGVISRYTVGYLERALRDAEAANATALIIRLGSQGAVLRDVRTLASSMAGASIPVVVYLAPGGTQAGVAGSWMLSAAHISAMAPDTSFGAAVPLAEPAGMVSEQTQELFIAEVIRQIRDWNEAQGRSTSWADQAARSGIIFTNEQAIALDPPAITLVARDDAELLTLLEGRVVTLADGSQRTLASLGRSAQPLAPGLLELLLLFLASPTVAFLLLVMAGLAIYAEFISPTVGILAGIGLVLLLASFIGFFALPIRWLSFFGIIVAFGFVLGDLFFPSHGALTVVGVGLLIFSSITLIDPLQAPGVSVALWAVVAVSLVMATFAAVGIYLVVRTRRQPVVTGQESLVGQVAEVRKRLDPEGMVFVEGALWRAVSEEGAVEQGDYVRITAVHELRLSVRRVAE